jgi:hypothetical protein
MSQVVVVYPHFNSLTNALLLLLPLSSLSFFLGTGWECEYCKRPIFMVVAALTSTTGSSSTQTTDDSNNNNTDEDEETFVPPKVGGCHQCLGRRTCKCWGEPPD